MDTFFLSFFQRVIKLSHFVKGPNFAIVEIILYKPLSLKTFINKRLVYHNEPFSVKAFISSLSLTFFHKDMLHY